MRRRVYSLSGLTEEELAVVMAKCARSPEPFDKIAETIDEEKASQFHEKYVLSYGHASVAEIAVPNFVFEGVTILASKILESMPRGAYQEKSTRMQDFTAKEGGQYTSYLRGYAAPEEARIIYHDIMDELFYRYETWMPKVFEYVRAQIPEDQKGREMAIKRRSFDALRYILPVGTVTNLGMRINGRDVAVLISKLLSSPVLELQQLGDDLKAVAQSQLPSLVRYADVNEWQQKIAEAARTISSIDMPETEIPEQLRDRNYCQLVGTSVLNDGTATELVGYVMMHQHGERPMIELLPVMGQISGRCHALIEMVMKHRGEHDPVPEAYSAVPLLFDITCDYGAYRDLQRHRRCEQFPQPPSTRFGYEIPDDIIGAGLEDDFRHLMDLARSETEKLESRFPEYHLHLYTPPLAYRNSTLFNMNMEEAAYIIELRTKPAGHISYRRIAGEMHRELMSIYPSLAKHIRCHFEE